MGAREIVEHHLDALAAGDVDAICSDYTDDAVVVTAMGSTLGIDAVRTMFSNIPAGTFDGFEVTATAVEGDVAVVTWRSASVLFGTDTFVLRDGRIAIQTVAMHLG